MSGTDVEDEFKTLESIDGDTEDDLGLFGDLGAFEGLALEEDDKLSTECGNVCPHCMGSYKNSRILSCLHVLCEPCLQDLLNTGNEDREEEAIFAARNQHRAFVVCPLCKQETLVGERGLSSLPLDPISHKKLFADGDLSGLICTSCKANEEAVAKCMDCDNLLCSICHTAHKYMRCFENHKVVTFDELNQSGQQLVVRKNSNCPRHPAEKSVFYCSTCQVPACNQCLNSFHMGMEHRTELLVDAESRCREELLRLCEETNQRQNSCRTVANKLEKMLGELQLQHDAARSAINEAHRTYIAMLEKKRDQIVEELGNLHAKQELNIMEACQRVDRTRDRIQSAVRYTRLLLNEAEPASILNLHGYVKSQMQLLHSTASKADEINVLLKFDSNPSRFEETLNAVYGYFVSPCSSSSSGIPSKPVSSLGLPTPSSTPLPPSPTHSSPLEDPGMGYSMPPTILKNDLTHSVLMNSLTSSMNDITNAPDMSTMDLSSLAAYRNSLTPVRNMDINPGLDSLVPVGSMTSIQEYNLQRLATLAEKTECQNSIGPPTGPPPVAQPNNTQPPFTLADLLAGDINVSDQALSNLKALAKLGSHNPLGLDALGSASHGVSPTGLQSMGTNLGLLVNGSSSIGNSSNPPSSPLEASLLASTLSAPPFVPSASVTYGMYYKRSDISSANLHWRH